MVKKFSPFERVEAQQKLSSFLIALIDYAKDKYVQGGLYPADQMYDQYVYGKASGDSENKVYFVDLDLEFGYLDRNDPQSCERFLSSMVAFIGGFTQHLEAKLANTRLTETRERYTDFLDFISPRFPFEAQYFRNAFQGQKAWYDYIRV